MVKVMPKRAQRSLIVISIAVFLIGVAVVVAGSGGATHVWRGGILVGILLSSSINGLTGMAIGVWLWGYCKAVRDRGEPIWLPYTLAVFIFLNGAALLLGSGTPFAPRPVAVGLLLFAIFVRLVSAGFAAWNFPRLRRSLKDEGKKLTRAELQQMVDELREAQAHVEQAHIETNNDAIKDAHERIITTLSILERLDSGLERLAVQ